eukprot:GFUD01026731.1.p1 GENE.GFUD01026731.1~~GFUD01026731.1.p1  ORF type:complete len:504 (+),score=120.85 GFUD01026731.1:68-1579(+)
MSEPKYPLLGSCRLVLTIMVFFGVYHLMALRFNLSMALVCMTNDPTEDVKSRDISNDSITIVDDEDTHSQCPSEYELTANDTEVISVSEPREFTWSKPFQGALLSSFFYGYIVTQVLGGYFSDRFGGKTVFLIGMTTLSGTSLLIPVFARLSPGLVVAVRVLQGLASGLAFPSLYNLFSSWSDPGERATLMSMAYAGIPTATVATFPLSSWLCYSGLDGGWPMAFYVPGTTGLLWCLMFYVLIYSTPEDHPRITKGELEYLRGREPAKKRKLKVPWLAMLKSSAVHALWITHICSAFGYYLLIINLSLFVREALGFKVLDNGFLSMLPSLGMLILSTTGRLFDYLRSKQFCSVSSLRKLFNSIAFFAPAVCFSILSILPCQEKVAHVALLALGLTLHELAMTGGFYFSHSELAGPYSGVLFGITNTFAQIPGFLTPLLVSTMTQHGSLEEWYQVFLLAGVVNVVGGLVYLLFGKCDLQPWAVETEDMEEDGKRERLIEEEEKC